MKVDQEKLTNLFDKACKSKNGLSRICLHELGSSKLQLMIIASRPGNIYPAISDSIKGWIAFTVLKGSLTINTYEESLNRIKTNDSTYTLKLGETLKINRNVFRETISDKLNGAIYMEVIEGAFDRASRKYLN